MSYNSEVYGQNKASLTRREEGGVVSGLVEHPDSEGAWFSSCEEEAWAAAQVCAWDWDWNWNWDWDWDWG